MTATMTPTVAPGTMASAPCAAFQPAAECRPSLDAPAFSDLLASMREMAMAIAPELHLQPFYLVQHPDTLPTPGEVWGYFCHPIAAPMRDVLTARHEWQGCGPLVAIVPENIRAQADEDPDSAHNFRHLLTQAVVHELAHALPLRPQPREIEPSDTQRQLHYDILAAWAASPEPAGREPWANDHGARFTRRALHLSHRAWLAGYRHPQQGLAAGKRYGQSSLIRYQLSLDEELQRTFDYTLAEIDRMPWPAKFKQLWQQDLDAWQANNLEMESTQ